MKKFETINVHEAYNYATTNDEGFLRATIDEAIAKLEGVDPYAEYDEQTIGDIINFLNEGDEDAQNIALWMGLNAARIFGAEEVTDGRTDTWAYAIANGRRERKSIYMGEERAPRDFWAMAC